MARYLIAGVMLFDDELYEVSGAGDVVQSVMLGAAASRCFSTVLEVQGSIVTKKELLHAGWERYGQQVSANSVNQSIAQIRRCLSSVGHCDYVVTVPRIGYKVSDALSIEKLGDCTQPVAGDECSAGRDIKPLLVMLGDQVAVPADKKHSRRKYLFLGGLLLFNMLLAFGWQAMKLSSPLSSAIELSYLPVPGERSLHLF